MPPDPDLGELPAELRDAGQLRIVGTDCDTDAGVAGALTTAAARVKELGRRIRAAVADGGDTARWRAQPRSLRG